jgi:hypothetical protein
MPFYGLDTVERVEVYRETVQIPEDQVNLIRLPAKVGLKPAAIDRTLGMPLSLVRRVLAS